MNNPNTSKLTGSDRVIADRILHILESFPKVSPSMLQISLGSGIPTELWKPILDTLISQGDVFRYQRTVQSPSGRAQVITVISSEPDDGSPIDD